MNKVIVIEDNETLALGLKNNLEIEGYKVEVAYDGPTGLQLTLETNADLVILDLMMPGMSGFDVLKQIRKANCPAPILILTAKSEEMDKVQGLRGGADDYMTKPFGLMELLARVEALIRRGDGYRNASDEFYQFGDVTVNTESRIVMRNGTDINLAPKEYELLIALLRRNGAAASRLELMQEVWKHSSAVVSRTVDTHIAELRRKLEKNPANPRHIITLRKTGYRLDR